MAGAGWCERDIETSPGSALRIVTGSTLLRTTAMERHRRPTGSKGIYALGIAKRFCKSKNWPKPSNGRNIYKENIT